MPLHILILYSGGLDSLIMKRYAEVNYPAAKVTAIWYDIGQPYARKEEAVLPPFVIKHQLPWLESEADLHQKENTQNIMIPGRNLVLAVTAACRYLPNEVWLGALKGETHAEATDKNTEFKSRLSGLLSYVLQPYQGISSFHRKMRVRFPLEEEGLNKLTATEWALKNGVPAERITGSSSCLSGEDGNCGQCIVCFRRWGIFKQLGLSENYNVDPLTVDSNKAMVQEMMYGNHYDDDRKAEILPALPGWFVSEVVSRYNKRDAEKDYCVVENGVERKS